MFGFNAKSVAVSHPCTALFHNHYEIAECNEKMASSEPSATLLHICSVWKEQKPHEVQAAFQVESAILRVKGANVCESRSLRKAPSGAGPRVFNGSRASPETTGHRAFKHTTPRLSAPLPGNVPVPMLSLSSWLTPLFSFPPLFFPRQRRWTGRTNVSTWIFTRLDQQVHTTVPGKDHFKCSYRRVTKSSLLLFKENKFHKQPQGQKHSPEEYEISNSLR